MIGFNEKDRPMFRSIVRGERGLDFIEFLEAQARQLATTSLTVDGSAMYRVQGASVVLDDLVRALKGSTK